MAAMMDCRDLAEFTMSNYVSGFIEARQPSQNDYERVLLHLITNSLMKNRANTSYRQTMQLFKVVG